MKSEVRKKNIHYKRAVFNDNHSTLQDVLISAFKDKSPISKVGSRKEYINLDDKAFRLVNHHKEYNQMFFGQLIFLEEGKSQEFVEVDDEAEYYKIDSLTTDNLKYSGGSRTEPDSGSDSKAEAKKREFVDSILYFGVYQNHMVVLQSTSLRSRDLETHLNWLLGQRSKLIPKTSVIILQDKPTKETLQKVEKSPVKRVKLGTPVETVDSVDNHNDEGEATKASKHKGVSAKKVKFIPSGLGVDVIRAALGEDWFNTLKLQDSLDDANLQVSLEISYLRRTTETGQKMLDNIATSLRHVDEADVVIDLTGGGKLRGSDLKLSGPIGVKMVNGRIDESDLFHQMHAWLVSKIDETEIEIENDSNDD